jgi:uncharacterized iron-regulated protein
MRLTIIYFLIILPFFSFSQDSLSTHFKIYNSAKKQSATLDDVVADMANADVLFYGEEHNDSIGHLVEHELLKKLEAKFPGKVGLSMEMFETDCQNVLNEYLEGLIREKNFITEARAWPNYKEYRPLIEFAKANQIPVVAANAPPRYVNMTNRMGLTSLEKLGKTGKSYLPPLPIDTATGIYYNKFLDIMGGHASMGGMQIYQAQNLWDATMGWSIAKFYRAHKGFKILQLNGSFHSEEKLGTTAQLKKYAPKAVIINIATYSDQNFERPDWDKLAKNGDYILVTGR